MAAVVWQKGLSIRETVELGPGVIAYPPSEASAEGGSMRGAKTSRHTIADRTAAILAKKPQLKGAADVPRNLV